MLVTLDLAALTQEFHQPLPLAASSFLNKKEENQHHVPFAYLTVS